MSICMHGNGYELIIFQKLFFYRNFTYYYGKSAKQAVPFLALRYDAKDEQYHFNGRCLRSEVKICLFHEKSYFFSPLPIFGEIYIDGSLMANIKIDLIDAGKYAEISMVHGKVISLEKEDKKQTVSNINVNFDNEKILQFFVPEKKINNLKIAFFIARDLLFYQLQRIASFCNYNYFELLKEEERISILLMLPLYENFIRKHFNQSFITP